MATVSKLTTRKAKALEWDPDGPGTQIHWEDEVKGLGLRLYPSGRKAFVLRYRIDGRQRMKVLGDFGVLTPQQAREKAIRELGKVLEGEDPLESRGANLTVGELVEEWMKRHAEKHRQSVSEDRRRIDKWIKPGVGSRTVEAIRGADVEAMHSRISGSSPVEANRVVETLRTAWNWGQDKGVIPDNVKNPADAVQLNRERSRTRHADPEEELPRLKDAIEAEESEEVRIFFKLLLLTGVRKSELSSAKWNQVKLRTGILHLPERKNDREFTLHLPDAAVDLLKRLPSRGESEWLFPSPKIEGPRSTAFRKQWDRIRERAKLDNFTAHDLRRTAGVMMASAGVPLQHISEVLGHQSEDVTRIYARVRDEYQREALEAVAEAFEAVGLEQGEGREAGDAEKREKASEAIKKLVEDHGVGLEDLQAAIEAQEPSGAELAEK